MKRQLVKLDPYKEGEDEHFSIIEVFPYLHYENNEQQIREDENKLFQYSLDPDVGVVNIHVRSREAQNEVSSFLIGHGFDEVELLEGSNVLLTECQDLVEKDEPGEIIEEPRTRRYYTINEEQEEKYLMSRSSLSIRVSFAIEELTLLKEVIKKLRAKRNYRNKWIEGNQYLIK